MNPLNRWVVTAFAVLLFWPPLVSAQRTTSTNSAQSGERRVALVIGNDSYTKVPLLRNARADAQAMANALRGMGFDVILRTDLNERGMREAVRNFKARLNGGSEALFYFAGHGVQLGAANYLLPVDISADNEEQVKDDGLPLQRVLDDLAEQKVRFSVAIIDACRDNPFPRISGRSIGGGRGLAPTTAATGQMVLFSAGAGQSALDKLGPGDRDPNGLFTRVLLKQMQQPGVPVDQVLKRTRIEVVSLAKSVGHDQVPALYDQTVGEFYFRPGSAAGGIAATSQTPQPAIDPYANDRAFWDSVKDSRNPDELRAYMRQFPNGTFAILAESRLRELSALAARPTAPVSGNLPNTPTAPAAQGSEGMPLMPAGAASSDPRRSWYRQ